MTAASGTLTQLKQKLTVYIEAYGALEDSPAIVTLVRFALALLALAPATILMGATLPQYVAWVTGTAVGVFAGNVLTDPEALGLDVVFPAFFLFLLLDELRRGADFVAAALIAAGIALALIPVSPPGIPIIAACAGALLGLRRSRA